MFGIHKERLADMLNCSHALSRSTFSKGTVLLYRIQKTLSSFLKLWYVENSTLKQDVSCLDCTGDCKSGNSIQICNIIVKTLL